ncbi:hypothetical protein RJT34_08882 [Clitoria ternatea]|uniref:Uncharacterized protein n=1 Tax=Clitoria ternatea TaxID=43366 RepID=A0AAN9K525_CLITE
MVWGIWVDRNVRIFNGMVSSSVKVFDTVCTWVWPSSCRYNLLGTVDDIIYYFVGWQIDISPRGERLKNLYYNELEDSLLFQM